jgi:predicted DNA-binding transcriptional regulator YafY
MIEGYLWLVRAGRLVELLGLLQARGRMTAGQLASELEVSHRTVLRDIEALSAAGIPVYAVRGSLGGFELLDGFRSDLPAAAPSRDRGTASARAGRDRGTASARAGRARVRLSPRGRRLAALLDRPAGIRIRNSPHVIPGRPDWAEAWVRIESMDAAVLDMLALGAEVEVVHPPELRARVREVAERIAALYAGQAAGSLPPVPADDGATGHGPLTEPPPRHPDA